MNLCTDRWLECLTRDGERVTLTLSELGREDVVDVSMPRQDFYGAAWQFLIGILQTSFAPDDMEHWLEGYEQPPSAEHLSEALSAIKHAFELFGDGPRFMQDFSTLEGAAEVDVAGLLIDAPGGNTLKMNTDHFIKRGQVRLVSPAMAAMALFTLQINAPSGGQGHRTGLRGGGPLTTLAVTDDPDMSLFQKLWLNVLPVTDDLAPPEHWHDGSVFPWLAPTKTSEKKGSEVYMHDQGVHALQQYWAMPRRIRLQECTGGVCDVTGAVVDVAVARYQTKNYGTNYDGTWEHPLSPYRYDVKKPESVRTSIKGQPGGLGYRQWHQFLFQNSDEGTLPALVVDGLAEKRTFLKEVDNAPIISVWVFGFDMDNMKARSWYEAQMPFVAIPRDRVKRFTAEVVQHVDAARMARYFLSQACKHAWFGEGGKTNGDLSFIDQQFWEETELGFFKLVEALRQDILQGRERVSPEACARWVAELKQRAQRLFDQLVLSDDSQDHQLKRKLDARRRLQYMKFKASYLERHELETPRREQA